MRRIAFLLIITALLVSCSRNEKSDFEKHFFDKTLRINLIHTGDANSESFKLDKFYDDGLWYGRTKTLINPYRLGTYYYELRDVTTDELLYSDGISTVFGEWRMTDEATMKKKSFNESIRIPYPSKSAKLTMYKIDTLNVTIPVWEYIIDRQTRLLLEPTPNHNNRIVRLLDSGNPKEKVDILILGDGYSVDDISQFDKDASRFYNIFINSEPFKSRKNDFNVHAVQAISQDGVRNLKTSDNIFGHDRYSLTFDEWAFREFATQSPYDYAVILINTDKNIGGSLYNLYTTTAIRSQSTDYLINHALCHQIVGSADRFYSDYDPSDSTDLSRFYYDLDEILQNVLDLQTK